MEAVRQASRVDAAVSVVSLLNRARCRACLGIMLEERCVHGTRCGTQ